MNKQKGIIIGVLALAVTMMVGYALFSETITINGTATAKGEFDVGIECQRGIDTSVMSVNDLINIGPDSYTAEGGYKNDSCSVAGNTMSFSSELEYPGATRYFTAKITNNGTIDAILDMNNSENVSLSQKVYYDANENGAFEESEIFDPSKSYDAITDAVVRAAVAIDFNFYGFEKADGTKFNVLNLTEEQMNEFSNVDGTMIKLKPGNSVYIVFKTQLNKDFGNTSGGSIYTKTESSYTFTFSQPKVN